MILSLLACVADPDCSTPCRPKASCDVRPFDPAIEAVLEPVDPTVPLTRTLSVTCDVPCDVRATWADEGRVRSATSSDLDTHHALSLVGMRPATAYAARLTITDGHGDAVEGEVCWTTDPLPADFPHIDVRASDPARVEPGDTIVGLASASGARFTVVLDVTGAVVWYRVDPERVFEARVEPDGRMLALFEPELVVESDWLGHVERAFSAAGEVDSYVPVDIPAFHHEIRPDADGSYLTLTHDVRTVTDFPTGYRDPGLTADAEVLVDRVVRFAQDGTILADHDLAAVLDVRRIGFMSLLKVDGAFDWSHANSVAEHADDGGLVVSLRHQDAVVELDPDTGAVRWILANADNWTPELDALRLAPVGEPFAWPYHQHAALPGDGGRLLLFDNGNSRTSPFTGQGETPVAEMWSRVVEYRIDEEARTVEQLWDFEPPGEHIWSGAMGNANWQPLTGNVLSLWGYVTHVNGVFNEGNATDVRIIEFVPETGEVVLDLALGQDGVSWNAFRAHRIPAL